MIDGDVFCLMPVMRFALDLNAHHADPGLLSFPVVPQSAARSARGAPGWTSFFEGAGCKELPHRGARSRAWTYAEFLGVDSATVAPLDAVPMVPARASPIGLRSSFALGGGAGGGFGEDAFWGRGDRPPKPSKDHLVAASAPEAMSSQMSTDVAVGGPGREEGPPNFAYEEKMFFVFLAACTAVAIPAIIYVEYQYAHDKALKKALQKKKGVPTSSEGRDGQGSGIGSAAGSGSRSAGRPIGSDAS